MPEFLLATLVLISILLHSSISSVLSDFDSRKIQLIISKVYARIACIKGCLSSQFPPSGCPNFNITEKLQLFPPIISETDILPPIRGENHRIHCRVYSCRRRSIITKVDGQKQTGGLRAHVLKMYNQYNQRNKSLK